VFGEGCIAYAKMFREMCRIKSVINTFMIDFSFHWYFLDTAMNCWFYIPSCWSGWSCPLACVQFSCWSLTMCLLWHN